MLKTVTALHDLTNTHLDQLVWRKPIDAPALELNGALGDFAALGVEQVGDRLQRRGLTGAIGSQQRDDLALRNVE